jgi:hypothetical protein
MGHLPNATKAGRREALPFPDGSSEGIHQGRPRFPVETTPDKSSGAFIAHIAIYTQPGFAGGDGLLKFNFLAAK